MPQTSHQQVPKIAAVRSAVLCSLCSPMGWEYGGTGLWKPAPSCDLPVCCVHKQVHCLAAGLL